MEGARPAIGVVGELEVIKEEKIETFCKADILSEVIQAIKRVPPYEEPAISFYPIEIA